jgi:hypothetical protein
MANAKTIATSYLTGVWDGLKDEIPSLFKMIAGDGETVLTGQHAEESKKIMAKIEADAMALKNGEISRAEFVELVRRRKAAIFTLYSAEKISRNRPSEQKVLDAMTRIATILITRAIPLILAL